MIAQADSVVQAVSPKSYLYGLRVKLGQAVGSTAMIRVFSLL
jgi:hypothetical protein